MTTTDWKPIGTEPFDTQILICYRKDSNDPWKYQAVTKRNGYDNYLYRYGQDEIGGVHGEIVQFWTDITPPKGM